MKVSLVVATGAHEGRVIPLTGPQFLIGRDQQCHLRPASQAISKLHCAVIVRDGAVYLKDFGSTNGTMVNDSIVQGTELVIADGASIRVGPLDFRLKVEITAGKDGTPLPGESPETDAALAAVKAAAGVTTAKPTPRDTTPNPTKPSSGVTPQPGAKPASNPGTPKSAPSSSKTSIPNPLAATKPGSSPELPTRKTSDSTPSLSTSESVSNDDQDRIAAMLLGMDDGGNGSVPDGSTVMDIPTPLGGEGANAGEKKEDDKPKKAQTREEMSSAANDLLRKYMRRPK